jgi:hypothetical protein
MVYHVGVLRVSETIAALEPRSKYLRKTKLRDERTLSRILKKLKLFTDTTLINPVIALLLIA